MKTNKTTLMRLVGTAILIALVIVLQTLAGSIKIGPFTITLSLVPIILGAVLFGPSTGALLGGVFGVIVCIAVVTGADIGGHLMFEQNPVLTLFICILKSTVAGFVSGIVCRILTQKGKTKLSVVLSAILCPICNSGILSIAILAFYHDLATSWALGEGFTNAFSYVLLGMIGINFLVELALNLVLIPVILRVIYAVKNKI